MSFFTVLLVAGFVQTALSQSMQSPSSQPAAINLPHINPRPLVLSLQKLISAHLPQTPSPVVDRRKAVTIGGGRWLKPLTFQVPDAISNFLPASSNIFKVHDDPKNKTTAQTSAAEGARPGGGHPGSNPFDSQQFMNAYDPLSLINNFDQNGFLKGAAGGGPSPFAFPPNASSPFAFDESQLSNDPLFALPNTPSHHFSASQFQNQLGDKQFSGMPLFDASEPEPNFNGQFEMPQQHQQQQQPLRQMKQPLFQQPEFYSPPDDRPNNFQRPIQSENRFVNQASLNNEPRYVNQASVNEARFNQPPVLSDEQPLMQQQQNQQPLGIDGIDHMAEGSSYRHKEQNQQMFQSPPTSLSFQGDYFPRKPHQRLPPSGSGNYDYSSTGDFFGGLSESDQSGSGHGHFAGDDFGSSKSISNNRPPMNIGYTAGGPSSSSSSSSAAQSSPSNFADSGKDAANHGLHEGHSTSLRPFFVPNGHQHHHHHHHHSQKPNVPYLASTEQTPFYHDHFGSSNIGNGQSSSLFGNDSKSSGAAADLSAASEFFSQHISPHLSSKSANEGSSDSSNSGQQKMLTGSDVSGNLLKSSLFEAAAKQLQEHSDAAASSFSNFFNNPASSVSQFQQAAASMLSPVVVKSDVAGGGGNGGANGQQSGSSVSGLFGSESKLLPLLSSNGVNVFPSALSQSRPVGNRIKEFFKSMLNQKY